jgi:hypothetical protein
VLPQWLCRPAPAPPPVDRVRVTDRGRHRVDGESLKVALVKADAVGETSVAVRLEGSNFTIIQGYSLVGPSMVTVGPGGSTSVDSDVVGPLLEDQVERYTRAAQK